MNFRMALVQTSDSGYLVRDKKQTRPQKMMKNRFSDIFSELTKMHSMMILDAKNKI